ncbi:MAG: hypothetical protein ACRDHN_01390, partial [Thermomicrobiales bacterium]
ETTLGTGQTFSVTAQIQSATNRFNFSVSLDATSSYPFDITAIPVASSTGGADCSDVSPGVGATNGGTSGGCKWTWTFTVPSNLAPGDYALKFLYSYLPVDSTGGVVSQTLTSNFTIIQRPTFAAPVVVTPIPLTPGDAFTIAVTATNHSSNQYNGAVQIQDAGPFTLNSLVPQLGSGDPASCGIQTSGGVFATVAATCTYTWSFIVPDDLAPGDYTIAIKELWNRSGDVGNQTASVPIKVVLPPPVFSDPVVSPNPVEQDGSFTIAVTVELPGMVSGNGGYAGRVNIYSTEFPFGPSAPAITGSGAALCTPGVGQGFFTPGSGTCTFTWRFRAPDDTAPGSYSIDFRYRAAPSGISGETVDRIVSAPFTVKERPGRLVMSFGTPQPASVRPGEQFTVTYTISIDRPFPPVSFPLAFTPRSPRVQSIAASGASCQTAIGQPTTFSSQGVGPATCTYTLVYTVPLGFTGDTFPIGIAPGPVTSGTLPTGQLSASLI